MANIIIISGKQYSGKDTLANILIQKMKDYKRVGIGDAIKLELAKRKGITPDEIIEHKHLYREELIELGDWGRAQSDMFWLDKISQMDKIIVPDIRVEFEAEYFKSRGAFLIRVNSNIENRQKRGIITNEFDHTEVALDDYQGWDYILENNSDFSHLERCADEIINIIKNRA